MIVLDTNVISTLMQPVPDVQVMAWFNKQQQHHFYLPSVVIAEIRFGLVRMPVGQRQSMLSAQFELLMQDLFVDRVLPFGQSAAEVYATLRATREAQGKPMSVCDAQIAAIAQVHQCAVATRNIKDFEGCGVELINPFELV